MGKLDQRVAIVTGGGTGIGHSIALEFAKEGADVVVCSRKMANLEKVAEEIKALGRRSLAIAADVSVKKQVQNMVKQTVNELGKVDILVNNAGILRIATILETTEQDWGEVIDINLKGVFLCTQAVAKQMIAQKYGKIINISSICGRGGALGDGPSYCVSKAGVIQLTQNAAFELGPYGINVNCIAPGLIMTPMAYEDKTPEELEQLLEERRKAAVLDRLGNPEDIARVALFLASEAASFISGQTIPVDGGRTNRM
jgi:NAD(P)-dependent dehydrogenase (short-subunit alcohol dehydrogenase family)